MKLPIFIRVRWKWLKMQPFERFAGVITSAYLSFFLAVLLARASELFSLPLNELGDFAAGAFAPLAFLWLILGYRQQGKELALSNESFRQQVSELRNQFELQRSVAERQDKLLDPELNLSYSGDEFVGGKQCNLFSLHNAGNSCRNVLVTFTNHLGERGGGFHTALLGENKSWGLNWDGVIPESSVWLVTVEYNRINGSKGKETFNIVRIERNRPTVISHPVMP